MHEERSGWGCGTALGMILLGMVPVYWLAGKVLGGPPTGVLAVVLAGVGFGLGYLVLNALGGFDNAGHRICPYCKKRIPEEAVACHRCGRDVGT